MCKSQTDNSFGPDHQMIIPLCKICNEANVADSSWVLASAIRVRFGEVDGELITTVINQLSNEIVNNTSFVCKNATFSVSVCKNDSDILS
jgi:hypothetical protein